MEADKELEKGTSSFQEAEARQIPVSCINSRPRNGTSPSRLESVEPQDVSPEFSRNPSPPPLTEEERSLLEHDKIGDTTFSRKWVLQILYDLVESQKSDGHRQSEETEAEPESVEELDNALETKMCDLWDTTIDGVRVFAQLISFISHILKIYRLIFFHNQQL